MANVKRVHYYHADATALGGHIETPFEQMIPVLAPSSLPPVGGYAVVRAERFRLEGILSFESAYTQVAGSVSHKTGGWTTLATSVVEKLNVLEVITADRVVSQIATEHPLAGHNPKVTFVGTKFENLCISGNPIEPVLDLDICGHDLEAEQFPKKCPFEDERFLAAAAEQYRRMNDEKSLPPWVKSRNIPSWVRERYTWDNAQRAERGCVLCSVVTQVNGEFPGRPFGSVLTIPEIGKVFLGELLVDRNTYRLIGMRVELGCTTSGSATLSAASIEGSTHP
jgi:hypothetical protein